MMNGQLQIYDYMAKTKVFEGNVGESYSFGGYMIDREFKLPRKNGGIGNVFKKSELEESIKKLQEQLQIKKPRTGLIQKRQQIENPLPKEVPGFKKAVEEDNKKMGFLGNELKKIEEREKRSREEILACAEILVSLKNAKITLCDKKKAAVSSSSSHPRTQQKNVCDEKKKTTITVSSSSSPYPQPQQKNVCDMKQITVWSSSSHPQPQQENVCHMKQITVWSSSSHPQPPQKNVCEKKKRKRNRFSVRDALLLSTLSTPPEMPVKIQETITLLNGTSPLWLTQKILTDSDVDSGQGRLFIPSCEALDQFMTDEERKKAHVELPKKKNKEIGLNTILVDPLGDQSVVSFREWGSLKKYVFTKTWRSLCERFNLLKSSHEKPNVDMVQIWCFRLPVEQDSKLCFAINILKNIEVQLKDENLDVDQSREIANSKCIEPLFDNFEARPLKKHCSSKLNSHESPVLMEALPQEEYQDGAAKAEQEWAIVKHV